MEPNFDSYLKGFASFGRSTSISVMVCDKSLQQSYHNALSHGEGTCNRQRTVIIGDKGVGKTSTLEMLTGGYCDPTLESHSTEGIDITICETSDLSPRWQKSAGEKADDPTLSAGWLVCKGQDCFQGMLKNEHEEESTKPRRLRSGCGKVARVRGDQRRRNDTVGVIKRLLIVAEVMSLQLICLLPLIVMVILNRLGNGFASFAWVTIAGMSLFVDFNNAFRFGTACALQGILIDVISNELMCEFEVSFNWDLFVGVTTVVISLCLVSVINFLCGVGGRTGMAVAFCLLTRPVRFGTIDWPADTNWIPTACMIALHSIGHLIGVLLFRQTAIYMQSMASTLGVKKISFMLIIIFMILLFLHFFVPFGRFIVGFVLGLVAGVASLSGVLYGRTILTHKEWLKDNYLIKKIIGFKMAMVFGQIIGWTMIYPFTWRQVVNISSFMLRDAYIAYRFHKAKSGGMHIDVLRDQLIVSSRGKDATFIKLVIWDFAGDDVYQFMQHFFLPKCAAYILVFNLEQAWQDLNHQVEKLKQWLYSVKAHSITSDAIVFLVGTHHDSVRDCEGFMEHVATCFRESLYNEFCEMLAINSKCEAPFFPVENSRPMDADGRSLRETIKGKAKELSFLKQKQPVRYLRLLEVIRHWRIEQTDAWFIRKAELMDIAIAKGFAQEDVANFLRFSHMSGELIYRHDDEIMREFIILHPQYLLDIMVDLLNFPPLSERSVEDAKRWRTLETEGVASVELLKEIFENNDDEMVSTITRFLEAYNMLLPVRPADDAPFLNCIVPSHLPDRNPNECWDYAPDDEIFYFDFGYVPCHVIFHRLLARCWYHHSQQAPRNTLYRRCGVFCFKIYQDDPLFFMLYLQASDMCQQLIGLVVQTSDGQCGRCGVRILQWMITELEDIRSKDFPNLPYIVGPTCQLCNDHQEQIKVLKICADGEEFPAANSPVMKFMKDGCYHEVMLVPRLSVVCGSRNRRSSSASSTESTVPTGPSALEIGEGARNITVIQAGDNSCFNIPYPREYNPET